MDNCNLVATSHVKCPICHIDTFGPYHDPVENEYYDGHYCEECGATWFWNKEHRKFEVK